MRMIFISILMFFSSLALAQSQHLLDITNDFENRMATLHVIGNVNGMEGLEVHYLLDGRLNDKKSFDISTLLRGAVVEKDSFTRAEVVLFRADQGFDGRDGGDFTVKFMPNVFSKKYLSKTFSIKRQGTHWRVFEKGRLVRGLHLEGNFKMGQVIGIRDLRVRN